MDANEAVEVLEKTIEWLNTLENEIGPRRLLDAMPNNFAGRFALNDVINFIQSQEIQNGQ